MAIDDYDKASEGELRRDVKILIEFVHELKSQYIPSTQYVKDKAEQIIYKVQRPFEE